MRKQWEHLHPYTTADKEVNCNSTKWTTEWQQPYEGWYTVQRGCFVGEFPQKEMKLRMCVNALELREAENQTKVEAEGKLELRKKYTRRKCI